MFARLLLGLLVVLYGAVAQAQAPSYQRDIQPIFTAKCVVMPVTTRRAS
ncbi:Peptidylprolyl isomerase OS=Stutzerimonas stutzeri OX=316 GN=CXK95_08985 PE=4 SV=1 [Stutzerimonas stutzeri]